MRSVILTVLFAVGCATGARETQPAPTTEPALQQPAKVALPEPPKPMPGAPVRSPYAVSMATFDKDQLLDECVDVEISPKSGQEAQALDHVQKLGTDSKSSSGGAVVRLAKSCNEQFPDRVALATCVVDGPGSFGRVAMSDRYYNTRTVGDSDRYMKDCLEMHGDWHANRNANAVERERIHQRIGQMERLINETQTDSQ